MSPIALRMLACALALLITGCASSGGRDEPPNPDPFESFNRRVFAFNETADKYVLAPAARGYDRVTPDPLQRRVRNFFANVGQVVVIVNNVLQLKPRETAESTGRFVLNSTVGVLGLFDMASAAGLPRHDEDFGQTLGYWGANPGPYIVLPFLGPSNVRDGIGLVADGYVDPLISVRDPATRVGVNAVRVLDLRVRLFELEEMITGDRYIFMRDAYLQRREFLVRDGEVDDPFGEEDLDDWDDW